MGEASYKEDVNTKSPSNEVKEKPESSNLSKSKDKSWEDSGNTATPKAIHILSRSLFTM